MLRRAVRSSAGGGPRAAGRAGPVGSCAPQRLHWVCARVPRSCLCPALLRRHRPLAPARSYASPGPPARPRIGAPGTARAGRGTPARAVPGRPWARAPAPARDGAPRAGARRTRRSCRSGRRPALRARRRSGGTGDAIVARQPQRQAAIGGVWRVRPAAGCQRQRRASSDGIDSGRGSACRAESPTPWRVRRRASAAEAASGDESDREARASEAGPDGDDDGGVGPTDGDDDGGVGSTDGDDDGGTGSLDRHRGPSAPRVGAPVCLETAGLRPAGRMRQRAQCIQRGGGGEWRQAGGRVRLGAAAQGRGALGDAGAPAVAVGPRAHVDDGRLGVWLPALPAPGDLPGRVADEPMPGDATLDGGEARSDRSTLTGDDGAASAGGAAAPSQGCAPAALEADRAAGSASPPRVRPSWRLVRRGGPQGLSGVVRRSARAASTGGCRGLPASGGEAEHGRRQGRSGRASRGVDGQWLVRSRVWAVVVWHSNVRCKRVGGTPLAVMPEWGGPSVGDVVSHRSS